MIFSSTPPDTLHAILQALGALLLLWRFAGLVLVRWVERIGSSAFDGAKANPAVPGAVRVARSMPSYPPPRVQDKPG